MFLIEKQLQTILNYLELSWSIILWWNIFSYMNYLFNDYMKTIKMIFYWNYFSFMNKDKRMINRSCEVIIEQIFSKMRFDNKLWMF
jgi:hypothetical protein